MKFIISSIKSLNKFERALWAGSVITIVLAFVLLKNTDYTSLCASLIGTTALVFVAKGNVLGQILCVIFGVFYGIISFYFRYYGEMITYLGMSAPVSIVAIITWIKNPHNGNKAEVKVNTIKPKEYVFMLVFSIAMTIAFYFILKAFDTNNLIMSTVSVFTSAVACYLTVRRSELYALGYALNDIILIVLWVIASFESLNYVSMVICFVIFLIYDIYGFICWSKSKRRQVSESQADCSTQD